MPTAETRSPDHPSSLISSKKTTPSLVTDTGFFRSTDTLSPVVSPQRSFEAAQPSWSVGKDGSQASHFTFNCDHSGSTSSSALPHSPFGLDRSKPPLSKSQSSFSFGPGESALPSFQTPFTPTAQVANPEPATSDPNTIPSASGPAKMSIIERKDTRDHSTTRSPYSMLFSPTSKLDSLPTTSMAENALTQEAVNGNISPKKPEIDVQVSGAKRKADERNPILLADKKRTRQQ